MTALKAAPEILKTVIEDGREDPARARAVLAMSGLAAGLNISFSALTLAVVGEMTGGVGIVAMLVLPGRVPHRRPRTRLAFHRKHRHTRDGVAG